MKIAVIGASGFVGDAVVRELAMRGHDVTAFARNAANIFSASNVLAVATDVNDADFAARLAGFDAVISAFNGGWTNPNLIADFRRGYAAILAAAQSANVPYLLVVGGAGNLYVAPGVRLIDTPQFPQEILDVGKAERDLLHDLLAADGLNWAMICPPACSRRKTAPPCRAWVATASAMKRCSWTATNLRTSAAPTSRSPSPTMSSRKRICTKISP